LEEGKILLDENLTG